MTGNRLNRYVPGTNLGDLPVGQIYTWGNGDVPNGPAPRLMKVSSPESFSGGEAVCWVLNLDTNTFCRLPVWRLVTPVRSTEEEVTSRFVEAATLTGIPTSFGRLRWASDGLTLERPDEAAWSAEPPAKQWADLDEAAGRDGNRLRLGVQLRCVHGDGRVVFEIKGKDLPLGYPASDWSEYRHLVRQLPNTYPGAVTTLTLFVDRRRRGRIGLFVPRVGASLNEFSDVLRANSGDAAHTWFDAALTAVGL